METPEEKMNSDKEESQVTRAKGPQLVITEEAKKAVYVNFSRLFFSDHDFVLELGQQLPAEEGNIVRISWRIAMTPQTAERLGNRLIRLVAEYKKEMEKRKQQTEATKGESRFNTTI